MNKLFPIVLALSLLLGYDPEYRKIGVMEETVTEINLSNYDTTSVSKLLYNKKGFVVEENISEKKAYGENVEKLIRYINF